MGNKEVAHHGGKRDRSWRKLIVDVGALKNHIVFAMCYLNGQVTEGKKK